MEITQRAVQWYFEIASNILPVTFIPMLYFHRVTLMPFILRHGHAWMVDLYFNFPRPLYVFYSVSVCVVAFISRPSLFFTSLLVSLCMCLCMCLVLLSLSFIIVLERLRFNIDLLFRAIHASANYFRWGLASVFTIWQVPSFRYFIYIYFT